MDFVFVETDRLATGKESKYVKGGQKPFECAVKEQAFLYSGLYLSNWFVKIIYKYRLNYTGHLNCTDHTEFYWRLINQDEIIVLFFLFRQMALPQVKTMQALDNQANLVKRVNGHVP